MNPFQVQTPAALFISDFPTAEELFKDKLKFSLLHLRDNIACQELRVIAKVPSGEGDSSHV